MVAIFRQGESSGGGRKPKVGARRTKNGVEQMWNGRDWVKAPNHGKKETSAAQAEMDKRRYVRPRGATGGRGGSFYTVNGITYDRKTGRPIIVPKNRQPVKAQDRTKKDPPAPPSGSNTSSSSSSGSSNGSSSTPRRNGFGVRTPASGGTGHRARPPELREADKKKKTIADRKKYLQTKEGGGLSKRMAAALADKDALKWKG